MAVADDYNNEYCGVVGWGNEFDAHSVTTTTKTLQFLKTIYLPDLHEHSVDDSATI